MDAVRAAGADGRQLETWRRTNEGGVEDSCGVTVSNQRDTNHVGVRMNNEDLTGPIARHG